MAKLKAVDVVPKIVSLFEQIEDAERGRAMQAVLTLLGDAVQSQGGHPSGMPGAGGAPGRAAGIGQGDEKSYFDFKQPSTKIEELAVAARYREEHENATTSTQADLQRVIRKARRNFDVHNYKRDIENARNAGLFARGTGRDSNELSHGGQNYVDALPNRDALKLRKPKKIRRRKRGKHTAN